MFQDGFQLPSDDPLGGRVRLRQLVDSGQLAYRSSQHAQAYLDRLGVPYVVVARQRHYRPADIVRAINDSEKQRTA